MLALATTHQGDIPLFMQQTLADGTTWFVPYEMTLPQGKERWLVVRTADGLKRAQSTLSKQVDKHLQSWEKKLWHVSTQTFETQQDAQDAWQRELKGKPAWLQVKAEMVPYTVTTTTEHVWKMDHRYNTLATVQ